MVEDGGGFGETFVRGGGISLIMGMGRYSRVGELEEEEIGISWDSNLVQQRPMSDREGERERFVFELMG